MIHLAKKFDRWLHSHLVILLALIFLIILKIPSFFEPYWYGDEGIYLTIGNAIRHGERLYTDIVDHKTPIIYFLAAVPNQFYFRALTLAWMIITSIAFYAVSGKLFKKTLPIAISTFVFVFLTSVPWLEGNIPNGELFVMGFVLVGAWFMTETKAIGKFFANRKKTLQINDSLKFYLSGIFFGLGILTKVPGLFDVVAWLAIFWFILMSDFKLFKNVLINAGWVLMGLLTPIVVSALYFIAVGSGQDYLQFGLLYNFHYASNWGLPFDNKFLVPLFTLPAKVGIAALIYLLLTFKSGWFKSKDRLIFGWFSLSLVGALLSNRPYPHYFQQLVPALALLIGNVVLILTKKKAQLKKSLPVLLMTTILLILAIGALKLLNFGAYSMWSYYQRFFKMSTGQISNQEYRQSFNYLMTDNYQAADIIRQSEVNEIFIWGTNPMLYALSDTNPTGRFTVSFHIKDLKVYDQTMASLIAKKPLFIVVMNDEHEILAGLDEYLKQFYMLNEDFDNFSLWKKLPLTSGTKNL